MPRPASDSAVEFRRLLEQRDLAAYRLVAAIETVIRFWEAQEYDQALALLVRARAEFERAEARINQFRNSIDRQGEVTHAH